MLLRNIDSVFGIEQWHTNDNTIGRYVLETKVISQSNILHKVFILRLSLTLKFCVIICLWDIFFF
jgi:hypothetical protein